MSNPIISVRNLGKRYRLGAKGGPNTLRDQLSQMACSLFRRRQKHPQEDFWALRHVNFDVQEGDVLGVIGRNGAGKSTLLKVLSQITEPTTGEVRVRGRVASLLEVGTGFHGELSGRENIYLNGAILGMSKAEIRRKFDEIVDFSGVDKFIDTPVKRYSSGMTVRLAFAVAAHLEPEILLVDEVLAVGDIEFQSRCLGKMGDVAKAGRTILFVSHNLPYIERLCGKAVLLEHGSIIGFGAASGIVRQYLEGGGRENLSWSLTDMPSDHAHFTRVSLRDDREKYLHAITTDSSVVLDIECEVPQAEKLLQLGVCVFDGSGQALFSTNPLDSGVAYPTAAGKHKYRLNFPNGLFVPGRYQITLSIYARGMALDYLDKKIVFDVIPIASQFNIVDGRRPGMVFIYCDWNHSHHDFS